MPTVSSTRVALTWLERAAARRDQATHAVWYRTSPGGHQYLALATSDRRAKEVLQLFKSYADSEYDRDREVMQQEINRLTLTQEAIRFGWPRVQGGSVYEIPGGPVVRVVNRQVVTG